MSENKKQIVFIEPQPTVSMYRVAKSLRQTKKYELILVCFSKVDKEFYGNAYDKILTLELSHKLQIKSLVSLLKNILNGKIKRFFKKIKEMDPYIFQITGPDIFSLAILNFLKDNLCPKIYYSNDLWGADTRNFLFTKNFWIKGEFQKIIEKKCFKKVNGVLNKKSLKEFELLSYQLNLPKMSLPFGCLDEWIFSPKKKKNKEIHIVLGGSPSHTILKEEISFMKIIKIITSQEIHLHTYGACLNQKDNLKFIQEAKINRYYHFHTLVKPNMLNKEMSKYNYGIFLEFLNQSKINSNPVILKTQLCSKMINYLEAGLPIIVNKQFEYMVKIIQKHNVGFTINFEDLKNLRKILEQKDYFQIQQNIKKVQEKFKLSEQIKDIEKFYDKVIKKKYSI